MTNKFYDKKGYTIKVTIVHHKDFKFLKTKIKEDVFILQQIGCEIESVSPITQTGDEFTCVITYKSFHKPSEHYQYYI